MSKYFRFQRVENFDPVLRTWHVTHTASETYVGEVRLAGPSNHAARRPIEERFHGTFATRVQAARWLKTRLSDPVIFDDAEDADEDNDDSN